jgi:hypothetical protein
MFASFHKILAQKAVKDMVNNNFSKSVRGEPVEPQHPSTSSGRTVHLKIRKLFLAMS